MNQTMTQNCAFLQDFRTKKLGENLVFYVVLINVQSHCGSVFTASKQTIADPKLGMHKCFFFSFLFFFFFFLQLILLEISKEYTYKEVQNFNFINSMSTRSLILQLLTWIFAEIFTKFYKGCFWLTCLEDYNLLLPCSAQDVGGLWKKIIMKIL